MSSILEALEKSERERNQGSVARYHSMQPPTEKSINWRYVLFALAAFTVAIALYFLALGINWNAFTTRKAIQHGQPELIEVVNTSTPTPLTQPTKDQEVKLSAAQPSLNRLVESVTNDDVFNYSELNDAEKNLLPNQPINVVSVSADKERSFVMFGDKMYREGNTLGKGAILEEIKNDYIIIKYKQRLIRRNLD